MKKIKEKIPVTQASNSIGNFEDEDPYFASKKWYEQVADEMKSFEKVSEQVLIELKDEAQKCHSSEVANYKLKNLKSNENYQWIKTAMSKGTIADKIAAYTVTVQDNPICNLETLRNLVNMVKVGKKKECIQVVETLSELFLTDLLKPEQNLKYFHQKPLSLLNELTSGNAITRRKILSAWYFEDQLKEIYSNFVTAINSLSHDSIESNKEKAINTMYKLLAGNPEQEKILLANIVNKLGDPSQKVSTKAIYCLGQLLFKHPNMQLVVLNEVEKMLFRPNMSTKAQYYGLCFLTQFYLNHNENNIAKRLIEVYFSFFKACIKKGEVDSRMMSALLMGVNRAYPYAKLETEKMSDHIDTLYRVAYVANFNISLHALTLLYQISDCKKNVSDRFYSALYKKLADPKLFTTTHHTMLLSLVYKALLNDDEESRVKIFIKRLLQISLYSQPFLACGILYLISQLISKRQNLQAFILIKGLPSDLEDNDEEEEEKYYDIKDNDDEIKLLKYNKIKIKDEESELENKIKDEGELKPELDKLNSSSWIHVKNNKEKRKEKKGFNTAIRNPLYAGGEECAYTELVFLKNHFHPTVSLFALNIINGKKIEYSGDPLKDFTLIRFLDRFVFKNPKKIDSVKGAHPTFGVRKIHKPIGLKSVPVNSEIYIRENYKNIPVDELFLHEYLQKKYQDREVKKEWDNNNSDLESVQSDEFNEMLDQMISNKKNCKNENDEMDYMDEIGDSLRKINKKNEKVDQENDDKESDDDEIFNDEDSESISDMDDDVDYLEPNEEDGKLFNDIDDDDYEDMVFDNDENLEKAKKNGKNRKKKESLFASADEFAEILEEEGASSIHSGGPNDFSNKDSASTKQIAWEKKRNWWLKEFKKASGKKKGKKPPPKRLQKKKQKQIV